MYQQQRTTRRTYLRTLFLPILTLLFLAQVGVTNLYGQQTTDVAVVEVTLPPAEVPVGTPVTISYTIANNGPADALDFVCIAQITSPSAPNDPLFQEQFLVEVLPVGQTMTIQTEGNWEAGPAGDYNVQIGAAYEFDNAPTNNFLIQDLVVTDGNNLLTLAEAVAILKEEVISSHPRADSLSAVYLSPPANASDSLIPPGVMIEDADSTLFLQYEHPVYFFFLDLYPGELFAHPVEYVAVNAIDGTIDRNTNVEIWPEIDGVTPDFGSDCFGDPNDRRVHGNGVACSEKADRYTPVATGNDGAWAVAVTGKLNKKVEKTTVDHDICKWKERINARGPEVTGANISSSTGKDGCGMTEKELCDAIEALKGKECDKVYFKYIGHGVRSGIFVWDNEHKRSKKITWRNLAKKLKAAGVGEVCIEITACHSGAIIDALKKEEEEKHQLQK